MAWSSAYKVIYIFIYSIHIRQIENYSGVRQGFENSVSILRIIVSIVSQLIKLPIYNFVFRLGTFHNVKKYTESLTTIRRFAKHSSKPIYTTTILKPAYNRNARPTLKNISFTFRGLLLAGKKKDSKR